MDVEALLRKYAVKNALEYGEAQKDAVIGKVFADNPELKEDAGAVVAEADEVIAAVNSLSDEALAEEAEQYEYVEVERAHDPVPDLPGAEEGEVVLRFAPNPNGPPTLGSSRGMVVNGVLREKYEGTLILRFDDTDPRTKRPMPEAYDWYQEDYAWLGYEPDRVIYSSQRFDVYIDYAEQLIEREMAYVCRCSPEEGRKYREEGTACPHRGQSVAENMAGWEKMRDGGIGEGEATLKMKTDLEHKNPAIRDWVAFRIIEAADHPLTGDAYRVWPLLDFASAIEDHEQGVTHIVRGKDLRASTERQQYIYDEFGWDYPEVRYWGRVNLHGLEVPMSTSTLKELIEDNDLEGWDDVRAPTVRALRRRGFQPEALREFWIDMGVTENDVEASMDTLNAFNRKIIDPVVDRYFFVENPVRLDIQTDEPLKAEIPNHPEEDHGTREYTLELEDDTITVYVNRADIEAGIENRFLRLKDLCNVTDIAEDGDRYQAQLHSTGHEPALERGAAIVQWVPSTHLDCTVHMPDGGRIDGLCEPQVPDGVVQFVRFGFVQAAETDEQVVAYYTHD